jgi:acyl-coenzyme A synthetase/AMP-(fatty) acid ligase
VTSIGVRYRAMRRRVSTCRKSGERIRTTRSGRASNVLAHHLLVGGVQREEFVMVYAYRSVEMVIAVMAILKIGAIFSVINRFTFQFKALYKF